MVGAGNAGTYCKATSVLKTAGTVIASNVVENAVDVYRNSSSSPGRSESCGGARALESARSDACGVCCDSDDDGEKFLLLRFDSRDGRQLVTETMIQIVELHERARCC